MSEPKFPELPVEVQVALINAASTIAENQISAVGGRYNERYDFFGIAYRKICDSLYKENRGRA